MRCVASPALWGTVRPHRVRDSLSPQCKQAPPAADRVSVAARMHLLHTSVLPTSSSPTAGPRCPILVVKGSYAVQQCRHLAVQASPCYS